MTLDKIEDLPPKGERVTVWEDVILRLLAGVLLADGNVGPGVKEFAYLDDKVSKMTLKFGDMAEIEIEVVATVTKNGADNSKPPAPTRRLNDE